MITTNLQIRGMTCNACEKLVTRRLVSIGGIESVKVDVQNGDVSISASRSIDYQEIEKVLTGTHYQVVSVE